LPDSATAASHDVAPEDRARAVVYSFLAKALYAAPKPEQAETATYFAGDESELARCFKEFLASFEAADKNSLGHEYHDLFIGVGRGELQPFGSYYLTGFLNEKPLAELRHDLDDLGFERAMGVSEPEDHIAALCDVMSQLVEGTGAGEFTLYEQERFFSAHVSLGPASFSLTFRRRKKPICTGRLVGSAKCS